MSNPVFRQEHTFDFAYDQLKVKEPELGVAQANVPESPEVEEPEFDMADPDFANVVANMDMRTKQQQALSKWFEGVDIDSMDEPTAEGLFRHAVSSPELLNMGTIAADGTTFFGDTKEDIARNYEGNYHRTQLKKLRDFAEGKGDLMSAAQDEWYAADEDTRDRIVAERGADLLTDLEDAADAQAFRTHVEGMTDAITTWATEVERYDNAPKQLPKGFMSAYNKDADGNVVDAEGNVVITAEMVKEIDPNANEETYGVTAKRLKDTGVIDEAKKAMDEAHQAENRKKRRDQYEARIANRNMIQTFEANAAFLSDDTLAFVASTATTGDFNREAFDALPEKEKLHALALVKIRRGEQNEVKALGFIPLPNLRGDDGEMRDTVRVLYGVGWSITDMFPDVWNGAVHITEMGMTEASAWYMGTVLGDQAKAEKFKKEVYDGMARDRKIKLAMTQDRPDADSYVGKTAQGFGDNFGFLLVSGVGSMSKLIAARGLAYANNATKIVKMEKALAGANEALELAKAGGKTAEIAKAEKTVATLTENLAKLQKPSVVMNPFAKAGEKLGAEELKAAELEGKVGQQTKEVQRAVEEFLAREKYAARLPEAKKAYNAARNELEMIRAGKKEGDINKAIEKVTETGIEYGRASRAANPIAEVESAAANGQFYDDLVQTHKNIERYTKWIQDTGRSIERAGAVAENALWYLPFYERRLDRAAANGESYEHAAHSALVTMIWSGFTEKQAFTKAAKLGISPIKMTRQSYQTILSLVGNAVIRKTSRDAAKRNLKTAGKIFLERQATNLAHGLDTAFNVTAQSVADEWGVMMSEIWNENKAAFDKAEISREQFMAAFALDERWINTAMETIKQGGWSALGFTVFSGTNARFGAWRNNRAQMRTRNIATPYANLKLGDGGIAEAHARLANVTGQAFAYHARDLARLAGKTEMEAELPDSTPEEKKAAKDARANVAEDAKTKLAETMCKVFALAEETGGIRSVDAIMEATGVNQATAELLLSVANDYADLSVREDARVMYDNFLEKLKVHNAEFAMRQFARYAPNVRNVVSDDMGNLSLEVDVGNGEWRTVGMSRDEGVTREAIEDACADDSDVARQFNERQDKSVPGKIVDENGNPYQSWKDVPVDQRAQYAAMVIEGNNRKGGKFFMIGKDGKKSSVPVADLITLVGNKTTGRVVSHEVSHSIYRAAEELGLLTLEMKAALADEIGIDRTSDKAQAWRDESHTHRNWEVEVAEYVARGYAEYTQGRSAPALPKLKTAYDSINKAGNWIIDNLFGGADAERGEKGKLDDLYEIMFRGELERMNEVIPELKGESPRAEDAKFVRREAEKNFANARDEYFKLKALVEKGKLGKNSPRFKAAKAAFDSAEMELRETRYPTINRNSNGGEGDASRFSLAKVDGETIAVADGYALTVNESKDKSKVYEVLSGVVGDEYDQKGEVEKVHVTNDFANEFWGSNESRRLRRKFDKLWRAKVSTVPILGDVLKTTPLGAPEAAKHLNKAFKERATFYRTNTTFGVKRYDGIVKYPCQVLLVEVDGKRYVYDISGISKPTLAVKESLDEETLRSIYGMTRTEESVTGNIITQTASPSQSRSSLVSAEEDAAYAEAVKNGDLDGARDMVRAAAAKAIPTLYKDSLDGLPKIMFHGSDVVRNKFRAYNNAYGEEGVMFTDSYDYATRFAFEKILNKKRVQKKLWDLIKNDERILEDIGDELGEDITSVKQVVDNFDALEGDLQGWLIEKANGDDGVTMAFLDGDPVVDYDGGAEIAIAQPDQIYSADVTYDDAGNLIPLSQLFNKTSNDIRYSLADTTSDAFKNWFGDWQADPENASKVVNEDGTPMVVYHGSRSFGFTTFDPNTENSNYGSHFGTYEQASKFAGDNHMYAVYLNIRNPYETGDIFAGNTEENAMTWYTLAHENGDARSLEIAADLENHFPWLKDAPKGADMNNDGYEWLDENILKKDCDYSGEHDKYLFGVMRELMELGGYDGLKYENVIEGDGYSFIALKPEQIKSATDNVGTFDPTNGDIRYSLAGNTLEGGEDYVKLFGKTLAADEIRKTLPNYDPLDYKTHIDKTGYVGSVFQKTFDHLLKTTTGTGSGEVVILAGGNGAGKSTFASKVVDADFLIDSTLGNLDAVRKQINAIIDNGQKPYLIFVYRDWRDALEGIEKRVSEGGHIVSPLSFANSHTQSIKNALLIADEFGDKINVEVVKNTPEGAVTITIDELKGYAGVDHEEIRREANRVVDGIKASTSSRGNPVARDRGAQRGGASGESGESGEGEVRYALATGEAAAIYIPDGHLADGSPVDFVEMLLDGVKLGETRDHNRLSHRKWLGLAKNGQVFGRVKFGKPYEITRSSDEYHNAMIAGTEYDIPEGGKKWYYPVEGVERFDSPIDLKRDGNYGVYDIPKNADHSETRFSLASLADACGMDVKVDEDGKFLGFFSGTTKLEKVTAANVYASPVGNILEYSVEMGNMSRETADQVASLFASTMNAILRTGDFGLGQQIFGSAIFTGIKTNADKQYGTTYDFPSICTKTQAIIDAMSENMVRLGRGLEKEEILALYQHVFDLGAAVPCPECYVFSRWIGIGGLLDNLASYQRRYEKMSARAVKAEYDKMVEKVNAQVEEWNASHPDNQISFGKGKGKLASKFDKEFNKLNDKIEETENKGEKPKPEDVARRDEMYAQYQLVKSMTWIENVYFADAEMKKRRENFAVPNEILFDLNRGEDFAVKCPEAWNWRCTQGAGYGKAITPYAESVLGEGIQATGGSITSMIKNKKAKKTLANAIANMRKQAFLGGQRFQSTSDARFENMTDYLVSHFEVQAMKGMVQLYTKVLSAVPFFAKAGDSVNMPMMPDTRYGGLKEVNGELVPADTATGGADPVKAQSLRKDHPTAGTITIGVNDEHIRALVRQAWRDFVIPYHVSGGDAKLVASMRQVQEANEKAKNVYGIAMEAKLSSDYTTTQGDKVLSDEVLASAWGLSPAEIERVHKIRDNRLAILTGSGTIDMEVVRSNKFLSRLYDRLNGGEWDGVRVGKGKVDGHIFPNEFFDTSVKSVEESAIWTRDYLEYCRDLGYLHRFSGLGIKKGNLVAVSGRDRNGQKTTLTDLFYKDGVPRHNKIDFDAVEPMMWKVLVDRRMLDNEGKYQAQKQVDLSKVVLGDLTSFAQNQQGVRNYDTFKANNDHAKVEDLLASGAAEGRAANAVKKSNSRFSLAIPTEVSSQFTTEDLLAMAAAGRMAKSPAEKDTPAYASIRRDMAKRLKEINPNSSDADVDRIMARASGDAKSITNGMEMMGDAEVINRLTDRLARRYLSTLSKAGKRGIKVGVEAERARKELDDRQAQKVADSIAAQTGIAAGELEATLGVDLAETLVRIKEIQDEAEKARQAEAEILEDHPETEGETEETEAIPTMDPAEAKRREEEIRKLCQEIADKAWQKTEEYKAKLEARKAKRAAAEKELAENPDAEEAPEPTSADDLAAFIATKRAIDLTNPEHFAQFIATMCEQKWIKDHGLNPDAYVWKDPVALQHLRMTAANVYASLARKLMYSNKRETALNTINRLENAPTYGSVLHEMEFCGKVIAQGMVTEKARDLVREIDKFLEQGFGASGRFKQNEEDLNRKVTGETEKWARAVRKVIFWGEQKCANELEACMERLAGVETEFEIAGRKVEGSKQFNKDMLLVGAIREYGNLLHKSLGEITDAKWKIIERLKADKVAEEAVAREERTLEMANILDKAFDTGRREQYDDTKDGRGTKAMKALNRYFQMHLDFKNLCLDLMRRAKDKDAQARAIDFVNNLQHEIQRRWDSAQTEMRKEREWFHKTIEEIYGKGNFAKTMSELFKHDERFDKFGQGEVNEETGNVTFVKMSKAQALNLYVAMQQKGYIDNVTKNNREMQSAELRALFSKEDLLLLKRLGDWYDRGRQGLSEVSLRLFGLPVEAEESNYFPVTPLRPSQGLEKGATTGWSPFPPSLTSRIRHGYDFDVRADIISVWMDHMGKQAQWKNMAELGVELRGIFGRQSVQSTIRRCHGEATLQNVLSFITDILNGQVRSAEPKWIAESIDWARGWAALASLGANFGVMIKQTTSIPAFAFEVGFVNAGKYIATSFTPEGIAAMREILRSDQFKNRWGAGYSEEVTNACNSNNPTLLKRIMQKSMAFNKVGDAVPALVVGQGVYRAFLRQGLDKAEALNRTWEIINRTQQTSQMDNLSVFQRRSAVGRLITQFQSTVRQYASYEIAAARWLAANPKSGKAWKDFARATTLNMALAGLYAMGGSLWAWILGKDPDEDMLNSWVESVLTSCWSSLFLVGSFVSTASTIAVEGKAPYGSKNIPALDLADTIFTDLFKAGYNGAMLMGEAAGWSDGDVTPDDFFKAFDHMFKRLSSPYRDVRKLWKYRVEGDQGNGGAPRKERVRRDRIRRETR